MQLLLKKYSLDIKPAAFLPRVTCTCLLIPYCSHCSADLQWTRCIPNYLAFYYGWFSLLWITAALLGTRLPNLLCCSVQWRAPHCSPAVGACAFGIGRTEPSESPLTSFFFCPGGAGPVCRPVMERGVSAKVKTNSLLGWRELWHCEALLSWPRW